MITPSQPSGHRTLPEIAKDYAGAELTALWIHERVSQRHILAFVVVELCPPEQEPSPLFQSVDKGGKSVPLERRELGPRRTAYVTRIRIKDPQSAVNFYRGQEGYWPLPEPLPKVRLEPLGTLLEEPPSEIPALVSHSGGSSSLGSLLPQRKDSIRVYSRLEPKRLLQKFLQPGELQSLGLFAQEMLGVDLLRFSEFQGAIQLCAPNPLLRGMSEWITADERHLVVEFLEREGCSVLGCTLEVTDLQASGEGFTLRITVTEPQLVIPIPNRPKSTRTRLLAPSGDCIYESTGFFPGRNSFQMSMEMIGHTRRFTVKLRDGSIEEYEVETVAADRSRNVGRGSATDRDVAQLLRESRERRELKTLEESRTFVYFEGTANSKQRAWTVVRELLGQVRQRCIICDPYLSADDVARFAPFVPVQGLPIRLLGARFFLKEKLQKGAEETEGDSLLKCMGELKAQDPSLVLSCRVLHGSRKSPVHDRFLVVDDDVYLLGSSLNEFGARATTLFKIPDPQRLITEIESWWSDPRRSFPLEALRTLPPTPEEAEDTPE